MFGEKILDYWDDIMKDLGDIIAIPSVAQPQDGPYPFGKDAATAVDKAIEIAERYGIKTKNSDYYAMHAELGEGAAAFPITRVRQLLRCTACAR